MSNPYIDRSVVVSPVGLVLTEWQGKRNAMTVSFFSEVAHHPTTLWMSIEQSSYTHELIQASGRPWEPRLVQVCIDLIDERMLEPRR